MLRSFDSFSFKIFAALLLFHSGRAQSLGQNTRIHRNHEAQVWFHPFMYLASKSMAMIAQSQDDCILKTENPSEDFKFLNVLSLTPI